MVHTIFSVNFIFVFFLFFVFFSFCVLSWVVQSIPSLWFCCGFFCYMADDSRKKKVYYDDQIVFLDHEKGGTLLSSSISSSFGSLSQHWEPQMNGGACGFASVLAVLRTAIFSLTNKHFRMTQNDLFQFAVSSQICSPSLRYGITLGDVLSLFRATLSHFSLCHLIKVQLVSSKHPEVLRPLLTEDLKQMSSRRYIVGNFYRSLSNHHRSGHFSPLSSYACDESGREWALVHDVHPKRLKPHWVPVPFLTQMMCREDRQSESPRGYIILSFKGIAPIEKGEERKEEQV